MTLTDKDFLPNYEYSRPTPNHRQWLYLVEAITDKLADVNADLNTDPIAYKHRVKAFAETMAGQPAASLAQALVEDLHKIKAHRKRARRFVEQFSDEEINAAFTNDEKMFFGRPKEQMLRFACGAITGSYRYQVQLVKNHEMFFKAWNFALDNEATKYAEPRREPNLTGPIPKEMDNVINEIWREKRRGAIKDAGHALVQARGKLRDNINRSDRLFARRFTTMWNLTTAKEKYEKLNARLTKPLEDYARWWKYGYRSDVYEYKHKGAQATYEALKQIKSLEEELETINEHINGPGPAIQELIEEVNNAFSVYQIIKKDYDEKEKLKKLKEKEKSQSQEKRIDEAFKKAKEPIKVQAVMGDDNTWIDQRALLEGLTGRTSVSKTRGRSFLQIETITIDMALVRKWIQFMVKDPETKRRIPKNKWTQDNWMNIQVVEVDEPKTESTDGLFITMAIGSMRISTTLYDTSREFERLQNVGNRPVLHTVKFENVKAVGPKTRQVWTPADINTYHPVIA
jgi:hypothetical protein